MQEQQCAELVIPVKMKHLFWKVGMGGICRLGGICRRSGGCREGSSCREGNGDRDSGSGYGRCAMALACAGRLCKQLYARLDRQRSQHATYRLRC